MRKFLFVILFSASLHSFSQTNVYHPFPDSNAVWVNTWSEICHPPYPGQCDYNYQYILQGDTQLAGKNYTKIYREAWQSQCMAWQGNYTCTQPSFITNTYGAIRNDTANKKVYYFQYGSSAESIFYDFALGIGDSVKYPFYMGSVSSIDSVLVGNNYRKRFNTSSTFGIVEGIGLEEYSGGSWWAELFMGGPCVCNTGFGFSCFWQDGINLYGDTTCSIISRIGEIKVTPGNVRVYPNPADGDLNIEVHKDVTYRMLSNLGEVLMSGESRMYSQKINTSTLPSGIYFLLFSNGQRQKIVVQH